MFKLPTIKELAERSRAAFRSNLKGSDAWLWPNNVYVSAKVIAGAVFEVFGFAAYIQRQMFAHTAPDIESLMLHGAEFGIPRKPAAPATGRVTFTATSALTVETGAILTRLDEVSYRVSAGGAIPGAGVLELPVVANRDGASGNAIAGTSLAFTSGVTGVATVAIGPGDIALGSDVEEIESYRQRILFRKRNPPHGGAASDYVMWAGEVAGVSFDNDRPTVFVERLWAGPGTIRVFPLMFDLYSNGIPLPADVMRVADYIDTVRPAGALVTVAAPIAVPVDVVISGLVPNATVVREAILAELQDAFRRLSRVAGADAAFGSMPYLASPTSFSRSWIWQAVANATGEQRHAIVLPAADIALQPGQLATLGTVSYV